MAQDPGHTLMLLRHAKSAWPDMADHDRPLAPRGIRAAPEMGRWLRDAGLRIFEITMTIPDAPALIRELSGDKSLLVGAGTTLRAVSGNSTSLTWKTT